MPENTPPSSSLRRALGRLMAQGQDGGPPDIDEMWRDFTRKVSNFFGFSKKGDPGNGGGFQPDPKSAGIGAALVGAIVVVVWLFSGSFIVQEGQRAVVTTFGKYSHTVAAGWGWHWPYPIQNQETINFTQQRTVEIGGGANVSTATGLRESGMLTQDENIVDIRFNVKYVLKDARDYLFENQDPNGAVVQAAESAVREIVGRSTIDSVLYQQRDALASNLVKSIQTQLDRLNSGILVVTVNVESVQPPEQVAAAFSDVVTAGVDRDRLKNEGQAYASNVIPKAQGEAAHLREDALAYKARVVGAAEGDSDRFKAIYAEYQKAPAVTRDRMYIDAMKDVFSNVTKVLVDTHGGTNLIQVPVDRIVQAASANAGAGLAAAAAAQQAATAGSSDSSAAATATVPVTIDPRSRDSSRSRDRDSR